MDAKELNELMERLQKERAAAAMLAQTAVFPEHAKKLMKSRICLECGEKVPEKVRYLRGCHEKCYKRVMRAIESFAASEFERIQAGKFAPADGGGRPPIPLSQINKKPKKLTEKQQAEADSLDGPVRAEAKRQQLKAAAKNKKPTSGDQRCQ